MIFVRTIPPFLTLILMLFLLSSYFIKRQRGEVIEQENLDKVPGIQLFLKEKAKDYHKKDGQMEECAICLEEFKTADGKQIAELNCNSKHIFHLNCLSKWAEKNNACPLCR